MTRLHLLIILSGFSLLLTALCGFLWKHEFKPDTIVKYPLLKRLKKWQMLFTLCAGSFFIISVAAGMATQVLSPPSLQDMQGPNGEIIRMATLSGLEKELNGTSKELQDKARIFFQAAEYAYNSNHFDVATTNYKESIEAVPTMSAYINVGISHIRLADYPRAKDAFDAGLKIANEKSANEFIPSFAGNIGSVYLYEGALNKALESYEGALDIDRKIGNVLGQANALGNIGIVYRNEGKLDEALKNHQEALKLHTKIGNAPGRANALSNIGIVYGNEGKLDEALRNHQEALRLHTKIGDALGRASDLGNIGSAYFQQGKLDEALESYEEALDIDRKIGYTLGQANDLANIANIYRMQGKLEEALSSYRDAMVLHAKIGYRLGQANDLANIGIIHAEQGKTEEGLKYLQDSLWVYEKMGNVLGRPDILANMGLIYAQQGRKKMALEKLLEARDLYQSIGANPQSLNKVERKIQELTQEKGAG